VPDRFDSRTVGVVLGAVVGDAFGSVLEGASSSDAQWRVERRAEVARPWRYTDDGAMNLAVAEWLAAAESDGASLLRRLHAHYDPARGFGRGMKIALEAFARGVPWDRCAFAAWPEGSRGNGAAVRVGPVACVHWPSALEMHAAARLSAAVTHGHPEAIDAALVQAHAVSMVLADPSSVERPAAFVSQLRADLPTLDPAIEAALESVAALIVRNAAEAEAVSTLGTSTLARESLPIALWAFLESHASYREAVVDAARLGGDVDSICALVGALAAALHGREGIPDGWLRNLEGEIELRRLFRAEEV
jgi:poly(ADP-ribose) glycohydrolase ARH3